MNLSQNTRFRPTTGAARWSAVSFLLLVAIVFLLEWQRTGSGKSPVSSRNTPSGMTTGSAPESTTRPKSKPTSPTEAVAEARPRSTPAVVKEPPIARADVPVAETPAAPKATTSKDTSVSTPAPATNLKRSPQQPPSAPRAPPAVGDDPLIIRDQTIRDQQGRVTYRGDIDLRPTLERIERGEAFPHRNDGAIFRNRERRLPQRDPDYYREYVHPTPAIDGPGPQRIVIGREGERYFTHDHYKTFKKLPPADPANQP